MQEVLHNEFISRKANHFLSVIGLYSALKNNLRVEKFFEWRNYSSNLIKILISNAPTINKAIDYNTFTESGLYVFDGAAMYKCQNAPDQQNTNCFVLVLSSRPRRTVQIIFPGNAESFYYRSSVVDSDNWTAWKKF